jgi:ADP-heptose:LPS heptosyltransferase
MSGPSKKKILIIRLKSIGDVLFTLPAVHAVRKNFPDARITYLVCKSNALLIKGFPDVDEIVTIDRNAMKKPLKVLPEFTKLMHQIRRGKFTHVIDLQGYGETAWLTRLTGAENRWGSVYSQGRKWVYTRGVMRDDTIHPADWNLKLLKDCGLDISHPENDFQVPEEELNTARDLYQQHGLNPENPTLFLQPFTSAAYKNWPFEKYLAVAEYWSARGVQILFCGGPADLPRLEAATENGYAVIAAKPLLVTAGLIKLASLVIGGDTGILHLAAALEKPCRILRTGAVGKTFPYQHEDWTLAPAEDNVLADIPVSDVVAACGANLPG